MKGLLIGVLVMAMLALFGQSALQSAGDDPPGASSRMIYIAGDDPPGAS